MKLVKPGQVGDIYITCLDNLSMPFIRYKIDDRGSLSDEECACGRKLQMFKNIEGRISDIITSPSGRHISLHFFH